MWYMFFKQRNQATTALLAQNNTLASIAKDHIGILKYVSLYLSTWEKENEAQLPMPSPHPLLIHRYYLRLPVTDQQSHASSWLLKILSSFQEWKLESEEIEFSGTQMAPLSRGESQALTGFLSWTYAFCPHRSWHVWCQPSSRGQAELLLQVRSQELSSTTVEGTHSRVTSDHGPWYQELPMTF